MAQVKSPLEHVLMDALKRICEQHRLSWVAEVRASAMKFGYVKQHFTPIPDNKEKK